jgi:hypothetical protein
MQASLPSWEKLAVRDPDKYGPAARQLRTKADRVLQRQKEQRQHEKKLRQGRQKPWAPLPAKEERPPSQRGRPGEAQPARSPKGRRPREEAPPPQRDKTVNRGPGGRRLTGKFRHS